MRSGDILRILCLAAISASLGSGSKNEPGLQGDGFEVRKRGSRPVLFWHPMKTGGTSLCQMALQYEFSKEWLQSSRRDHVESNCKVESWEQRKLEEDENTQEHMLKDENLGSFALPVQAHGIRHLGAVTGRSFFAYEPSYPIKQKWKNFNATGLLDSDDVWDGFFHVMAFRHPVGRVFSHMFFEPRWKGCRGKPDFTAVMMAVVNGTCKQMCAGNLCSDLLAMMDNFYVKHLSGSPANLTLAAHNLLHHIDVPFDLTRYAQDSIFVLNRALGWNARTATHYRPGPATEEPAETYPDAYAAIASYVEDDYVLYLLAMEKFRRVFVGHGGTWDVVTSEDLQRVQLWEEWLERTR
mmetsp:Transcript_186/g.602  ORF Transcript_186/g.602 Transcript_186/m.602 type:complete len:352 (+) Transcript_186:38-1093(+)